jgi:hypothetical protein
VQQENDDINELLRYYEKSGKPDVLLTRKAFGLLGRIPKDERAKAIEWLLENQPKKFGLDIPAIRLALTETGTKFSEYIPAEDWTCDACGMQFKYIDQPTNADKHDRGLFDLCPRCGFQVCWTKEIEALQKARGLKADQIPEWYDLRRDECKKAHEPGTSPHYNRREDDAFTSAENQRAAQRKMLELSKAKKATA